MSVIPNHVRRCAAACLLFVPIAAALAQSAPIAATTLVISGSREPLAPDRLAADVAVIDADTLRGTTADSLADVLRREAGVQMSRSGGPGQSTGIFLRGASSQQSVVMVDGVRVGSATLGYAALESLSLSQVDRIEVLRGPGSSLYGADAVGGVVQVFTQAGGPGTQVEGRAAVGGYGSREASGSVRGAAGGYDYAVGLAHEQSDGVSALRPGDQFGDYNPDRDGYRLDTARLRLGFAPTAGQHIGLALTHSHLNAQYDGAEPVTYDPTPDLRTRRNTDIAALDWRALLAPGLAASARLTRSADDERDGAAYVDTFATRRQLAAAQLAWQVGALGQLVGAVEHGVDRASSSSYTAPVERRNDAFVGELTGATGVWSWQADARRDRSSDFGAVATGRLGGSVQLGPGLRLRALVGNTFRAPSFNDLYFPGYGVPTLAPERGQSREVGISWRGERSEASATLYRNRVRDLIGYESDRSLCPVDPAYDYGCAANTSRARLQGATIAAAHRSGGLMLKAQIDFLEAHDEATGARLARRAAHQATLAAEWTRADWTYGASLLQLGGRPDSGKWLAPETTLDLHAVWRVTAAWQLQAKLLNAGNQRIEPARDYQGLGRQAWLVVRYER